MNMALLIPEGDTLVTYYILPLLGINKKVFGRSFKTTFISKDGLKVYIELSRNMTIPVYKENPYYITEIIHDDVLFVMFTVPSEYIKETKLFTQGLYSKFSARAKRAIYHSSSLPYNKSMGSFTVSHPILQALDKTKTLRNFLHTSLKINKLAVSDELIDLPDESWYIENRF